MVQNQLAGETLPASPPMDSTVVPKEDNSQSPLVLLAVSHPNLNVLIQTHGRTGQDSGRTIKTHTPDSDH